MHNVHFHSGVGGEGDGDGGREMEMGGLLCEVSHGCSLSFFGCKSRICVSIIRCSELNATCCCKILLFLF